MKLISRESAGPQWWHDQEFDCPNCPARFRLEDGDDAEGRVFVDAEAGIVTLPCPRCRTTLHITRHWIMPQPEPDPDSAAVREAARILSRASRKAKRTAAKGD